ncbi:hypothetical protein F0Q45_18065 [Mycobacterium simiae]|uniref:Transmembrane protein n=1 Tax=Mycobacterium simiae TaxID=1784 RepID=A0A5B1BLE0_MYCSI|nr:hypothetical protein [Mycobacterium simiae]KAA1248902.1 hypothetical protein F0Q45_18065 [Mycobacterium simiae]
MAEKEAAHDRQSSPGTEPFVPNFDSDAHSVRFAPDFTDSEPIRSLAGLAPETNDPEIPAPREPAAEGTEAISQVQSVTVPGRYTYLKRWKFVLVLLGVWFAAAEVGLSLYYWWYHTIDKTPPVFMVLVYVVVCTVAGLMLSMVEGRPLITALSLAVMSSPFASVAAGAPLYGYFYCEQARRCLIGVLPY